MPFERSLPGQTTEEKQQSPSAQARGPAALKVQGEVAPPVTRLPPDLRAMFPRTVLP